ncbi:MAG TPA: hypothetical protein VEI52_16370 [Terriglobales bacterium]|nr:hypothetical protein [Terriglobales bacterium]
MGRSAGFVVAVLASCVLFLFLAGCSGGKPVTLTQFPVPASVSISPSPSMSLEIGTTASFFTTVLNATKASLTEPVTFVSSNPSVASVAANGLVCGGSWDSLTSPGYCTPGRTGQAQVVAIAEGVSSPPTTVYVHQHIDQVGIRDLCAVASPPAPCTLPRNPCQSLQQLNTVQNTVYEAHAFSQGNDVTSTVGQFTWQAANLGVVTLSSTNKQLANLLNGISLNQVVATAQTPGMSPVVATIGSSVSTPITFTTCAVQSIALEISGATANTRTIAATVTDSVGNVILSPGLTTPIGLTWSSSQPGSVTVTPAGLASVTSGAATIIASCTPPTCNTGFVPSLPIYPENAEFVESASSTSTSTSGSTTTTGTTTVYASSTACGTISNCVSTVVPIIAPANTVGTSITLPVTPNSLVFNRQGSKAYLGTDSGLFGSKGLIVLDSSSNTITQFPSTPGKVLAVSPDGAKVIVSDTADLPNQLYVFDTASGTNVAYAINGASAADFSPDSLKAYIIAGSTLYVYSRVDALQKIPLSSPARDVAFFAEGAFAYLAGGVPAGVLVLRTCDNGQAGTVSTSSVPTFIRALPNATQMLAVIPPNIDVITASTAPTGCSPTVSNVTSSLDLGYSNFTPTQLIVSEDGSTAYLISPDQNAILSAGIVAQTSSTFTLRGNAAPLAGSLSPDGSILFVGASDGTVHTVHPEAGGDVAQAQILAGLCQNPAGRPFTGISCSPNLVAVKP